MTEKDEILRVLNENGKWTGKYENRLTMHQQSMLHNEVVLRIIDSSNGGMLVQLRSSSRHHANKLGSLSGHVEMDETLKVTLLRESMEEMGLDLRNYKYKHILTVKQEVGTNRSFLHNYLLDCANQPIDLSTLKLQKEEVTEVFWMPYEEWKRRIREGDTQIVCKAGKNSEMLFDIIDKAMSKGKAK